MAADTALLKEKHQKELESVEQYMGLSSRQPWPVIGL
jgi:hypothetical protein